MYGSTVSAEFPVRLVVLEQELAVDLLASLHYTAADPYAVRLAFHLGPDDHVEWVVARDLLSGGLETGTGPGDVRVWPARPGDPASGPAIYIELTSPAGGALFEVPRGDLADFLRDTTRIVPHGTERAFIDIDGELADLLRWA